jgi:hypothetical protein
MCQLHLEAAGLAVGHSKLSTESWATRLSKYSLTEVTQSGLLKEKPNCTKNVTLLGRLFSKHLTQFGTVGVRANAIVTKVTAC